MSAPAPTAAHARGNATFAPAPSAAIPRLISHATHAPVAPPPGWNPSQPPPPGTFVAWEAAPIAQHVAAVSVPVPGSGVGRGSTAAETMLLSSAQPSPFSLLTPPAPPAPKAAPGFLAQHDFVGAEAEFMHIMRLAAESPPAPPGAIARVGFLHGLLNAHYAAISVMGGPAYSLPPLPASLSMPGAPPTQTAPAPAGVPANSASPTAQRKAHSWAAAVSPLAAAPGVKILQRTGAPAAPTDASQPRQTRPEPVKPDTVASVLSGPVPKSLGGSRMNANDVLNVNRTFFRNFAECESPPQIAQSRRGGFLTPTSTVRVVPPMSMCAIHRRSCNRMLLHYCARVKAARKA